MRLSANAPKYFGWLLNTILGLVFLIELIAPNSSPLLYPSLVTLAMVASVAAMNRRLPLQNVLLAAGLTAVIGAVAHGLSANPNFFIPFGPIVFTPASGQKIFASIPWTIPCLWIVAIFNARGVVRLILRPWRKTKNYGWWVIALTATLVLAFDVALEPFAVRVKHLWRWQPTKISLNWQGTSPIDFLGWFLVTLFILAFISPPLIRKQPGNSRGPDYHSLLVWLGALLLFAVGCAQVGLWLPVTVDAAIATITLILAVRGAKW
jgi:uncharacterized membrane protein